MKTGTGTSPITARRVSPRGLTLRLRVAARAGIVATLATTVATTLALRLARPGCALLLLATLGACVGPTPQPLELVLLRAPATSESPAAVPSSLPPLVVGPVTLPGYAARAQVLVLEDGVTLRALPGARWAEPLENNFARVLLEGLAARLATSRIGSIDSAPALAARQLVVEVTEFVADAGGTATLRAGWRLLDDGGRRVALEGRSALTAPVDGRDAAAVARALGAVLEAFAAELAEAVRRAPPPA